jgi:predicted membrane protein
MLAGSHPFPGSRSLAQKPIRDSNAANIAEFQHRRLAGSPRMSFRPGRNVEGGLIGGTIIVVVGLIFMLDNMGLVSVGHLFRFWPLILVIAGLASLASSQGRVKGAVLIVLGALFELDALGIAHFSWSSLWPLAIIGAGLMVMWTTLEARRTGVNTGDPRNTLNEFALFGGCERRVTSLDFKGGSITAIFGGIEIDLRQATIADEQAELTINALFGGCEIRVPDTWEIVAHGQGIFGGSVDSTNGNIPTEALGSMPRKILILRGVAVFGGVEIKN